MNYKFYQLKNTDFENYLSQKNFQKIDNIQKKELLRTGVQLGM